MKRIFSFILIIAILGSCSPKIPKVHLNDNEVNELGICVDWGLVPEDLKLAMKAKLDDYIIEFNNDNREFKLVECSERSSINFTFQDASLISPGQQSGATIATVFGLAVVPALMIAAELPFFVVFYYLPQNNCTVEIDLSKDIRGGEPFILRSFETSPYFGSMDKQVRKQSDEFIVFFDEIITGLEKDPRMSPTQRKIREKKKSYRNR